MRSQRTAPRLPSPRDAYTVLYPNTILDMRASAPVVRDTVASVRLEREQDVLSSSVASSGCSAFSARMAFARSRRTGIQPQTNAPVAKQQRHQSGFGDPRLLPWTRTSGDAALLLVDEAEDWAEGKAAAELPAAAGRAIAFILRPPRTMPSLRRPSDRPGPTVRAALHFRNRPGAGAARRRR